MNFPLNSCCYCYPPAKHITVTYLDSPPAAPSLPGRSGLGGGITRAGPGRPLSAPVRVLPNQVHPSHLLCLQQLHHQLGAAVLVEGSQKLGQRDHHSATALWDPRLQCHRDEPEKKKLNLKKIKILTIKVRSRPAAATATPPCAQQHHQVFLHHHQLVVVNQGVIKHQA